MGRNNRKCPHCMKLIDNKPLNKHLNKRLQKLHFRHSCMDRLEGESSSDLANSCCDNSDTSEPVLRVFKRRRQDKDTNKQAEQNTSPVESAFEAFKKTDKYKAILKKMGKMDDSL